MSEPFVGEVRMFAGNFAPRGWAFCDGQLLAVSQNDALFSLLGTIYGGDGRTTFGLPDLRGRIPIHQGNGHRVGEKGGQETVTLTVNQLPSHNHPAQATTAAGNSNDPDGRTWASVATGTQYTDSAPDVGMNNQALADVGGSQSHSNLMPFLCVHFIIALFGIYPSRN